MFKKTVTYEDWDGNETTETLYFNLTKSEILNMEYNVFPGRTFTEVVEGLVKTEDTGEMLQVIKSIILLSHGVKSPDGKRFIKNDTTREEFEQSAVFDEFFMEIATNSDSAAEFLNGVIPSSMTEQLGANPEELVAQKIKELKEAGN